MAQTKRGAAVGCSLIVMAILLAGCGGSTVSTSQVAAAASAQSCDNSGFYVQSKITNEKDTIYDCRFSGATLPKCVTYSGNIARDATEEVTLLFSDTVGGQGKPRCLAERRAAEAKAARRAALKRERRYETALNRDAHAPWHRGYRAVYVGLAKDELPNIYFKWLPNGSFTCAPYTQDGCWKMEVITRKGCPASLSVEFGEYSGATKIGTVYGEAGSVDRRTPTIIELDADTKALTSGHIQSMTCF